MNTNHKRDILEAVRDVAELVTQPAHEREAAAWTHLAWLLELAGLTPSEAEGGAVRLVAALTGPWGGAVLKNADKC